jgi:RNA polymerase sigma-32 factor
MSNTVSLPTIVDGGLSRYLQEIQKFPMLEEHEEQTLARSFVDHGDVKSAEKLVTSHLRLVAKIAMGFRGYGLPVTELISEGNIGLMQAVKKFDPDKGNRLSTYAMWWIRASIQEYVLRSWSLVKMGTTAAQKKLFFNLRRLKNRIQHHDGDLAPNEVTMISEELNVPEQDVIDMDRRMYHSDQSLNYTIGDEEGGEELISFLADEDANQEVYVSDNEEISQKRALFAEAMKSLNEREQHILTERHLKEPATTLDVLSKLYGISRERVRQIEARTIEKLQNKVKETA